MAATGSADDSGKAEAGAPLTSPQEGTHSEQGPASNNNAADPSSSSSLDVPSGGDSSSV